MTYKVAGQRITAPDAGGHGLGISDGQSWLVEDSIIDLSACPLERLDESARENLPTIGEKNSPEQIPCFVQYHYTKRRVAPPFFFLSSPSLHPLYMVAPAAAVAC